MKKIYKGAALSFILAFLLLVSLLIAVGIGAVSIPVGDIFDILFRGIQSPDSTILLDIRMPRVLLAGLIGAGLAAVGTVMQGIFKNPLVDSYTLGMSAGAALGAVISIVGGIGAGVFGLAATGVFAFIGSISTLLFVYGLAYKGNRSSSNTLLLAGVAVSYFLASLISFMMMLNHNKIQHIVFWTMGSIGTATWSKVVFGAVTIMPGIILLLFFSRELNIMTMGEEAAQHLGVHTARVKAMMLVIGSIIVGGVVSTGGTIGFVGLIAPHIVRFIAGSDNRRVIPNAALLGAILVIISDTIGRTIIQPAEIPVGVMTSIMGGPFFIYLLRKQKSRSM
ncbi:MAG: FecCD family ABC transporter permease [Bacillota bacterium]